MTKANAKKIIKDLNCESTVKAIVDLMASENYDAAKKILEVANYYIANSALVDADLAKGNLEVDLENDDTE